MLRWRGEKLPRRYGSGEGAHPPAPPSPLRRGTMWHSLIRASKIRVAVNRRRSLLAWSRVGWGALPVDPYLLGVVEAANANLVAGPRLRRRARLSVVYGESPPPRPAVEAHPSAIPSGAARYRMAAT